MRSAHLAQDDDFLCRLLQHSVQHAVAQPDGSFPCPVLPVLMLHVGLGKSDEHQTGVHQVAEEKEVRLFRIFDCFFRFTPFFRFSSVYINKVGLNPNLILPYQVSLHRTSYA